MGLGAAGDPAGGGTGQSHENTGQAESQETLQSLAHPIEGRHPARRRTRELRPGTDRLGTRDDPFPDRFGHSQTGGWPGSGRAQRLGGGQPRRLHGRVQARHRPDEEGGEQAAGQSRQRDGHPPRAAQGIAGRDQRTQHDLAAGDGDSLFEPFVRRGRSRTGGHDTGIGLGLSIVRSVASAHGDRVSAHTRSGGGLDVEVVIPT
ncbi:MAG: sensor histidine kinase [Acidimicrobiia bacterium]